MLGDVAHNLTQFVPALMGKLDLTEEQEPLFRNITEETLDSDALLQDLQDQLGRLMERNECAPPVV